MSRIISTVSAAVGWYQRFETWLAYAAGSFLVVMAVTTLYEVVARYAFHSPTRWSMELNIDLMVYFAFLAGAYTQLHGHHVRVDIIFDKLSPRKKAAFDIFTFLLALTFVAVLVWKGLEMSAFSLESGKRSGYGMEWPEFPLQIIIPIGSLLLGLQMIIKIVKDIHFVFTQRPPKVS